MNNKISGSGAILVLTLAMLSGCGKEDTNSEIKDEVLDTPQVSVSVNSSSESSNENDDIELIDGRQVIKFGEDTLYVPYISESDKVAGVSYIHDELNADSISKHEKILAKINKPLGTEIATEGDISNISLYRIGIPEFAEDIEGEEKRTSSINSVYTQYIDDNINHETYSTQDKYKHYINNMVDVQGISLALYENFYEERPQITVKLYGIHNDVWNKYLGEEDIYSSREYGNMLDTFKQNGYDECDLFIEKQIDKTGVYYIDYNKYNKDGAYKQMLIEISLSEYIKDYSYCVWGFEYKLEDEEKFQGWKDEHSSQMLGE